MSSFWNEPFPTFGSWNPLPTFSDNSNNPVPTLSNSNWGFHGSENIKNSNATVEIVFIVIACIIVLIFIAIFAVIIYAIISDVRKKNWKLKQKMYEKEEERQMGFGPGWKKQQKMYAKAQKHQQPYGLGMVPQPPPYFVNTVPQQPLPFGGSSADKMTPYPQEFNAALPSPYPDHQTSGQPYY